MHSMKCSYDKCSGFVPMIEVIFSWLQNFNFVILQNFYFEWFFSFIFFFKNENSKPLCNACHREVSEEKLKEYEEVIHLSDHHLQNMTSSDRACILCYHKMKICNMNKNDAHQKKFFNAANKDFFYKN